MASRHTWAEVTSFSPRKYAFLYDQLHIIAGREGESSEVLKYRYGNGLLADAVIENRVMEMVELWIDRERQERKSRYGSMRRKLTPMFFVSWSHPQDRGGRINRGGGDSPQRRGVEEATPSWLMRRESRSMRRQSNDDLDIQYEVWTTKACGHANYQYSTSELQNDVTLLLFSERSLS